LFILVIRVELFEQGVGSLDGLVDLSLGGWGGGFLGKAGEGSLEEGDVIG